MKAVILAGGLGLRLRGVVKDVPKVMASVAGRPFLEYLILWLKRWNIYEVILSIGYKGDIVKSYFSDGEKWGIKIAYTEEKEPLGTGGALRKAVRLIDDKEFVVMNGDSFFDIDINKIVDFHKRNCALATMGLTCIKGRSRYGLVGINNNGRVLRFVEKDNKGDGYINGGFYVFNHKILDDFPSDKISLENEVFPTLVNKGLYGMVAECFFVDIGIPEDYMGLNNDPKRLVELI